MILFLDNKGILDIGIRQSHHKYSPTHTIRKVNALAHLSPADAHQNYSLSRQCLPFKLIHVDIRTLLLKHNVFTFRQSLFFRRLQELKLEIHLQLEGWKDQKDTVWYLTTSLNEKFNKISKDLSFVFAEVIKGESKASLHRATLYDISLYLRRLYHVLIQQLTRKFHPQLLLPHVKRLESTRSKQDRARTEPYNILKRKPRHQALKTNRIAFTCSHGLRRSIYMQSVVAKLVINPLLFICLEQLHRNQFFYLHAEDENPLEIVENSICSLFQLLNQQRPIGYELLHWVKQLRCHHRLEVILPLPKLFFPLIRNRTAEQFKYAEISPLFVYYFHIRFLTPTIPLESILLDFKQAFDKSSKVLLKVFDLTHEELYLFFKLLPYTLKRGRGKLTQYLIKLYESRIKIMAFEKERPTFTCSLCHIMCFVKYDDAIFNDLLVVGKEECIKEVVVRHDKEICELLCLDRVEIRAEFLLQTKLLHFLNIQQGISQLSSGYSQHFFPLSVIKASSLHKLGILLGIIRYLLQLTSQLYPLPTGLYFLFSPQYAQVLLEAELIPGSEDGHIGSIASLLQLLLHLFELGVSPRHVYHIMLDFISLIHLLNEGQH